MLLFLRWLCCLVCALFVAHDVIKPKKREYVLGAVQLISGCAVFWLLKLTAGFDLTAAGLDYALCGIFALIIARTAGFLYLLMRWKRAMGLPYTVLTVSFDLSAAPLLLISGENSVVLIACAACLASLCALVRIAHDKTESEWLPELINDDKSFYLLASLIPLCAALVGAACFASAALQKMSVIPCSIITLVSLAVFCLSLFVQYLYVGYRKTKLLNGLLEQWQTESRDYMNTIRSQRHDFNIHLHALVGMIENGEYDKCREYIDVLVKEANEVNDIMPIYDAVVGSMLYNMQESAKRKGVSIVYDIRYDMKDVVCSGFECNKIIGNLIQNALDAVTSEAERAFGIHVTVFKRRGNTVVTVSNYFEGDTESLAHIFDVGYSTKARHEGIGLPMVERTLKKHGGRIYMEVNDKVIKFTVNIPNRLKIEEGGEGE